MDKKFNFNEKRIFGMIHLSGDCADSSNIHRALDEINIYKDHGLYGCIIENYFSSDSEIEEVLQNLYIKDFKIGINVLPNDYVRAFELAGKYDVDFIQFDYISGTYKPKSMYELHIKLDLEDYLYHRSLIKKRNVKIFGGVWPKYYTPIESSNLVDDIYLAEIICDAIVVTGAGTGKETPIDKIKNFNEIINNKVPLIIGAGLNHNNLDQLQYANGAIVGSAFKYNINDKVEPYLVRTFMEAVTKQFN